jgi:hypothetical protein
LVQESIGRQISRLILVTWSRGLYWDELRLGNGANVIEVFFERQPKANSTMPAWIVARGGKRPSSATGRRSHLQE